MKTMSNRPHLTFLAALLLGLGTLSFSGKMVKAPAGPLPNQQDGAPVQAQARHSETGLASWYGRAWQGHRTASGVRYDMRKLTAAHRSLPLNTKVRVTNLENGRSVEVTINDRGPYVPHRVIDLSARAARDLGMTHQGLAPVKVELVKAPAQSHAEFASAVR
jgi:rare lipoprotein A (peptidoglycan hydrolase)